MSTDSVMYEVFRKQIITTYLHIVITYELISNNQNHAFNEKQDMTSKEPSQRYLSTMQLAESIPISFSETFPTPPGRQEDHPPGQIFAQNSSVTGFCPWTGKGLLVVGPFLIR
jgi:hypothetical protein